MGKLDDIVADYISRYRERAEKELRWFSIQRTLEDAVRISALAKSPTGKRLPHQRRLPESVLRESYRNLLNCRSKHLFVGIRIYGFWLCVFKYLRA